MGILFTDADGSISNVSVIDITQHDGCQEGIGIRVNALAGTPRTVTITGVTVTGFQKEGSSHRGRATVNVSGSTFGPADSTMPPGLIAQNAVQYGVGGAGGTFTGNTVVGRGFGGDTSASTAILVFERLDSGSHGEHDHRRGDRHRRSRSTQCETSSSRKSHRAHVRARPRRDRRRRRGRFESPRSDHRAHLQHLQRLARTPTPIPRRKSHRLRASPRRRRCQAALSGPPTPPNWQRR